MAEQKVGEPNGSANPGPTNGPTNAGATSTPRRAAQASGEPSSSANERRAETAESNRAAGGGLTQRKRGYLIALRSPPGLAEPRVDALYEALAQMEDIEIVRRLRPKGFKGLDMGAQLARDIIVVRMDEQRAEALRQSAQVLVEPDARLSVGQIAPAAPWSSRGAPTPRRRHDIGFRVLGVTDQPLAGAGVTVFGRNFTSQAITDSSGKASAAIFDADGDLEDIHAVYVQPAADYWECFVRRPALSAAEVNVVRLDPLFPVGAKTAGEHRASWGRKVMHLDRLANGQAGAPLGAGVKIGLIDSGCDNNHPLLRHITRGVDLSRSDGAKDWTRDEIGQGTHCAGIIAGVGGTGPGVSGIAPGAEIHIFKLSPGGHASDLIDALDQCIERHVDIACIGVSTDQASELVVQKIIEARLAGVACIAAAGDDGGPVRFPAAAPGVLSVSAIGRLGEFPPQTHHGWTVIPELVGPSGLFAANFSAAGPQIGACAPGVAVISSAPGGGFAARDGTAIAAAHVTGLAAQVLSRHPLFQGAYKGRGEARVHALFELIASSASPPVFDLARVGAGLPDMERVPGLGMPGDSWIKAAQTLGDFAFATGKDGFVDRDWRGAGVMPPPGYAASGAMALMQLRVAGLI